MLAFNSSGRAIQVHGVLIASGDHSFFDRSASAGDPVKTRIVSLDTSYAERVEITQQIDRPWTIPLLLPFADISAMRCSFKFGVSYPVPPAGANL